MVMRKAMIGAMALMLVVVALAGCNDKSKAEETASAKLRSGKFHHTEPAKKW